MLFHSDAVQGVGKVPFDVEAMNVDLASITAHKMYGPKGVGALYVRRSKPRVRLAAQMDGGGHERGMRSGTLNVPGIVGFGKAAEIVRTEMARPRRRASSRCASGCAKKLIVAARRGSRSTARSSTGCPGNLNVSFAFVEGEAMMMAIKDVAVSSRLGLHLARSSSRPTCCARWASATSWRTRSIRFGLGRFNTEEEVDYVADLVIDKVNKLREMSPLYEMHKEGIDLEDRSQWAAALRFRTTRRRSRAAMAYSDKVIEHYENPRNVGTLDKNDPNVGTGLVGAPACGDVMRLQLKVSDEGVIEDAKFKTFGCGSAIASSLARRPSGSRARRVDEAETIKNTDDRRGAQPAAGEDPLLGARRGRDQERHRRLPRSKRAAK